MASPDRAHLVVQKDRKRMVQPVLPVLPRFNKEKKKDVVKDKEEAQAVAVLVTEESSPIDLKAPKDATTDTNIDTEHVQNSVNEDKVEDKLSGAETLISRQEPIVNGKPATPILEQSRPEYIEPQATLPSQVESEPTSTVTEDLTVETPVTADENTSAAPTSEPTEDSPINTDEDDKTIVETKDDVEVPEKVVAVSSEASSMTANSDGNGHIELSSQPVPTIPNHSSVSPEAQRSMEPFPAINGENGHVSTPLSNGHVPPAQNPPGSHHPNHSTSAPARGSQMPTILEHLLHLANSKQYADWVIEINQPTPNIQPFLAYAHGFVLLRSERVRKLITRQQDPAYASNVIQFFPPRSIQPHAFEAALRFLYSDTVLSSEALFPRDTYMDKHARAHVVDYTLSYWISGMQLGLEPVTARAYNLLAGMVDWDIAELLVKEALSLRALSPPVHNYSAPPESIVMAESILRLVFDLFVHHLDVNQFKFDSEAQATVMTARLAHFESGRPPSNPALAGMVFGSMPTSGSLSPTSPIDASSSSIDMIASTILINLDYGDLCTLAGLLTHTHNNEGSRIIKQVVEEREKRRLAIIATREIPNKQRMANSALWDGLGYREFSEDGKIMRERVGYLLPSGRSHKSSKANRR